MRNAIIIGATISTLVLTSFTGLAVAANSSPRAALATRLGATSCASFVHMSKARQDRLVRRMVNAAPTRSLTVTPSAQTGSNTPGQTSSVSGGAMGTVLQASGINAACQAAPPDSSLRGAYSLFVTGGNTSGQK